MARKPKPWYRKDRKEWYVTIDGTRYRLGPDKQEAERRFHKIMATPPERPTPAGTVQDVQERFLLWAQRHRAQTTYEGYKIRLEMILGPHRMEWAEYLRPYHIQAALDARPDWSASYRAGIVRAVKRLFNWCVEQGLLDKSPLKNLRAPAAEPRNQVVSLEQLRSALASLPEKNTAFRDLAWFVWHTGCRPQEAIRIEARHLDLENQRMVLPPPEAKGRRKPRIIYLPPPALAIVLRLADAYPEGPLLRNLNGRPWTKDSVGCTFGRIQQATGGRRLCLYALRHSYATHQLQSGTDAITLGRLLGHEDPSMLAKVYANVGEDAEYMLRQAARK